MSDDLRGLVDAEPDDEQWDSSAYFGIALTICIVGSRRSSPRRVSPAITAIAAPAETPMSVPQRTRLNDAQIASRELAVAGELHAGVPHRAGRGQVAGVDEAGGGDQPPGEQDDRRTAQAPEPAGDSGGAGGPRRRGGHAASAQPVSYRRSKMTEIFGVEVVTPVSWKIFAWL